MGPRSTRRPRRCVATLSALATILVTLGAEAQHAGWTPRSQGNRLGADLDLWPTNDWTTVSVGFIGQVRLTRHFYLDFDFPWAFAARTPGPDRLTLGNPTIGVHYATALGRHAAFFIGGSGTIPTHYGARSNGAGNYDAAVLASYARALYDLHRFLPEYVYVRAPVGLEMAFRPLFLRFYVTPVFWGPVGNDVRVAELVLEHATEIELLANMGLGGGIRLQAVVMPTRDNDLRVTRDDEAQLAFEPFFAYEPEPHGFFARVGLLVAVDRPYGFGFEHDRVATVRATLGGKW